MLQCEEQSNFEADARVFIVWVRCSFCPHRTHLVWLFSPSSFGTVAWSPPAHSPPNLYFGTLPSVELENRKPIVASDGIIIHCLRSDYDFLFR